ncbi:MAG: hypothetical protein ABIM89_04505 [Mycobacteriales bacterium]
MVGQLTGELQRIEVALRSQGMPLMEYLSPSLSEDRVASRLASLGLGVPVEVVEVFGWHNGYTPDTPGRLAGGGNITPRGAGLLTLDQAADDYYARGPGDLSVAEIATPSWFPVLKYNTGLVVINCDRSHEEFGLARHWDWWPTDDDEVAVPIAEVVSWWAHWLETGQWACTAQGWIDDVDFVELTEIQRRSGLV